VPGPRSSPTRAGREDRRALDSLSTSYLTGACLFDYQTVEQRAERLLELERPGLSLDEPLLITDFGEGTGMSR
jgi:hypothetical protein